MSLAFTRREASAMLALSGRHQRNVRSACGARRLRKGNMNRSLLALGIGWSVFVLAGLSHIRSLARAPEGLQCETADDSAADADAAARSKKIEALIEQLGNDDYFTRERAQQGLAEIGFEAFDAVSDAADNHDDIEIKRRAGYLVRMM